jgi:hypothetical protein
MEKMRHSPRHFPLWMAVLNRFTGGGSPENMKTLPFERLGFVLGLMLANCAVATAAAPETAAGIVELPKFVITDDRELPAPESWRYTAVPGFEILSDSSNNTTERFVRDFLLLQEAIRVVWPAVLTNGSGTPTTLLLVEKGSLFEHLVKRSAQSKEEGVNSLILRDGERTVLAVNFGTVLNETDLEAEVEMETRGYTTKAPQTEYNPVREVYRQYFRHLLRRASALPPPPWLEEGLVQLLASMDFSSKHLVFGRVGERADDFNYMLNEKRFIPLAELFKPEGPAAAKDDKAVWSAQTHAFVHWGLYGMRQKNRAAFVKFTAAACQKPVTPELFYECFQRSYKQMQIELRAYVRSTTHGYFEKPEQKDVQVLPEPPAFAVRDATQAEIGRLKGESLSLVGDHEAARLALIAPYIRNEHDPALLAALGLYEQSQGNKERALKLLEAATKAKVSRPRAYLELARLRYTDALAHPAAAEGRFSTAQVSAVLAPCFAARGLPPVSPEVYELIADAWAKSAVKPRPEHLGVLDEGVRNHPRRVSLITKTAQLYAWIGDGATARQLADLGLKTLPPGAPARLDLERLLSGPAATP